MNSDYIFMPDRHDNQRDGEFKTLIFEKNYLAAFYLSNKEILNGNQQYSAFWLMFLGDQKNKASGGSIFNYSIPSNTNDRNAMDWELQGIKYYFGLEGVSQDAQAAMKCFKTSVQMGRISSVAHLGYLIECYDGASNKYQKIINLYNQAINYEDTFSMHHLAKILRNGAGGPSNPALAREYYKQASNLGNISSMYQLAQMHENGEGGPVNLVKARSFYQSAAEFGNISAMCDFARMLNHGEGGPVDAIKARDYYQRAAECGHRDAISSYAMMLDEGRGGSVDVDGAINFYILAADQGDTHAMYKLGSMFEFGGDSIAPNIETALSFYKRADDAGYLVATSHLAKIYEEGKGVPPDAATARKYYERASHQSRFKDVESMYKLRMMLECGEGGPIDKTGAKNLYLRSGALGHLGASKLYELLNQDDIRFSHSITAKEFDLTGNRSLAEADCCQSICHWVAMSQHPRYCLTSLKLSGTGIDFNFLFKLKGYLALWPNLKVLHLDNNPIGGSYSWRIFSQKSGIEMFSNRLYRYKLEELNLNNTGIDNLDGDVLCSVLEALPTITSFKYANNKLDDSHRNILERYKTAAYKRSALLGDGEPSESDGFPAKISEIFSRINLIQDKLGECKSEVAEVDDFNPAALWNECYSLSSGMIQLFIPSSKRLEYFRRNKNSFDVFEGMQRRAIDAQKKLRYLNHRVALAENKAGIADFNELKKIWINFVANTVSPEGDVQMDPRLVNAWITRWLEVCQLAGELSDLAERGFDATAVNAGEDLSDSDSDIEYSKAVPTADHHHLEGKGFLPRPIFSTEEEAWQKFLKREIKTAVSSDDTGWVKFLLGPALYDRINTALIFEQQWLLYRVNIRTILYGVCKKSLTVYTDYLKYKSIFLDENLENILLPFCIARESFRAKCTRPEQFNEWLRTEKSSDAQAVLKVIAGVAANDLTKVFSGSELKAFMRGELEKIVDTFGPVTARKQSNVRVMQECYLRTAVSRISEELAVFSCLDAIKKYLNKTHSDAQSEYQRILAQSERKADRQRAHALGEINAYRKFAEAWIKYATNYKKLHELLYQNGTKQVVRDSVIIDVIVQYKVKMPFFLDEYPKGCLAKHREEVSKHYITPGSSHALEAGWALYGDTSTAQFPDNNPELSWEELKTALSQIVCKSQAQAYLMSQLELFIESWRKYFLCEIFKPEPKLNKLRKKCIMQVVSSLCLAAAMQQDDGILFDTIYDGMSERIIPVAQYNIDEYERTGLMSVILDFVGKISDKSLIYLRFSPEFGDVQRGSFIRKDVMQLAARGVSLNLPELKKDSVPKNSPAQLLPRFGLYNQAESISEVMQRSRKTRIYSFQ